MQQVRIHGPGDVRVDEVRDPEPGPGDVLVRVAACGICGSDLSYISMGGLAGPHGEPMCLGHEIAGTVEWVGQRVGTARVGDRVVVHPGNDDLGRIGNGAPEGGLTPVLLVTHADRGRLHPVPDSLALEVAAFAEPLAVGDRCWAQLRYRAEAVPAVVRSADGGMLVLDLDVPVRAIAPGQSGVLYDATQRVLGGGVIASAG